MFSLSILFYFALLGLYLAAAQGVVRTCRFYQVVSSSAGGNRYESLDGLRGILALSVAIHHAIVMQRFWVTGRWSMPTGFFAYLGPVPVNFFFVITGFLFWSKAIRNRGRIDALALWRNRLRRIAPMCLFTVALMFAIAAVQSRFRLCVPLAELAKQVLGCLTLGLFLPRLNGVDLLRVNAGVFWTLRFEWSFYIALPLLACCATTKRLAGLCVAALPAMAVAVAVSDDLKYNLYGYFLLGMIAAQLVWVDRFGRFFRSAAVPLQGIALAAAVAASCASPYGVPGLMFIVFLAIAYDSPLVAFLRWPPARFLGTISYSIYLIHGIVLYVVYHAVNHVLSVTTLSPPAFGVLCCSCGLLTIFISAATYRHVEHPFLAGTRVGKGAGSRISRDVETLRPIEVSGA